MLLGKTLLRTQVLQSMDTECLSSSICVDSSTETSQQDRVFDVKNIQPGKTIAGLHVSGYVGRIIFHTLEGITAQLSTYSNQRAEERISAKLSKQN